MNRWSDEAVENLVLSMVLYSGASIVALLCGGFGLFGLGILLVFTCFSTALLVNEMAAEIIPPAPLKFVIWALTIIPCTLAKGLLWFMKALDSDIDRGGENDD